MEGSADIEVTVSVVIHHILIYGQMVQSGSNVYLLAGSYTCTVTDAFGFTFKQIPLI